MRIQIGCGCLLVLCAAQLVVAAEPPDPTSARLASTPANSRPIRFVRDIAPALTKAGVPSELHVYSTGGHGFGLRPSSDAASTWPKRCEEWLASRGLLK